jgi:hypothetical protein
MDILTRMAQREWRQAPTLENAARYIRVLEQGSSGLFPSKPTTRNRRLSSEILARQLATMFNEAVEMLRFGKLINEQDQLIAVRYEKRPRRPWRGSRQPKHPRIGAGSYDRIEIAYDRTLDGEGLKLAEILKLAELAQEYLGGEVIDIEIVDSWGMNRQRNEYHTPPDTAFVYDEPPIIEIYLAKR